MAMKTYPVNIPKSKQLPEGGIVKSPAPNGEQPNMITGNWRILRPVVDQDKCTLCMNCWAGCPDACITVENDRIVHDLRYCKGCGICTEVCPVEAVARVPELDFEDGVVRLEKPF
jgi:2-oxoacid:acceptor oxidoreductase delta subunit (pyruvate/2-ketoisovalerate family)